MIVRSSVLYVESCLALDCHLFKAKIAVLHAYTDGFLRNCSRADKAQHKHTTHEGFAHDILPRGEKRTASVPLVSSAAALAGSQGATKLMFQSLPQCHD